MTKPFTRVSNTVINYFIKNGYKQIDHGNAYVYPVIHKYEKYYVTTRFVVFDIIDNTNDFINAVNKYEALTLKINLSFEI